MQIDSNAIRHWHQEWNRVLFEFLIPDHKLLNDVDAQHVLLRIVRDTILDVQALRQILIIESLPNEFIMSFNEGVVGLFGEVTLQEVKRLHQVRRMEIVYVSLRNDTDEPWLIPR